MHRRRMLAQPCCPDAVISEAHIRDRPRPVRSGYLDSAVLAAKDRPISPTWPQQPVYHDIAMAPGAQPRLWTGPHVPGRSRMEAWLGRLESGRESKNQRMSMDASGPFSVV